MLARLYRPRPGSFFLLALVATSAMLGYACSANNTDTADEGAGGFGGSGTAETGPTTAGTGGSLGFDASDEGSTSGPGCSADLKNVLDENGVIVKACPPDQGCAAGQCVPACEAAAASKGSVGCDFMVATPSFFSDQNPGSGYSSPCFAVFLANNWGKEVHIEVTRGGASLDPTTYGRIANGNNDATTWPPLTAAGLLPNQVAVLFMSRDPATNYQCPSVPLAVNSATAVLGTGRGQAFHFSTDLPVSAYDVLPFGGAPSVLPSAELILPTTAWGTNYVAVVPPIGYDQGFYGPGPQWGQVVATADNTTVQIAPTAALPAGTGVAAAPTNVVTSYTLDAGEFIQWEPSGEMSGSVLSADKPIGVSGGSAYLCIKSATGNGGGCDSSHQQIAPVSALGSEYVAAPYASRMAPQPESVPYRIVGSVAGTTLSFDPPVPSAPTTLGVGQVADFESTTAFTVKSQDIDHPFYVGQMMTGCTLFNGNFGCDGDEEHVNVLPPAQFLPKYIFFTDPTYQTTNLVITRIKTASGFKDVSVDCLGVVSGWQSVGSSGTYEYTTVDLVKNGQPINGCTNGPHAAESEGSFGLTVWGLSGAASYAYPAGGNVATINRVVVPPIPK